MVGKTVSHYKILEKLGQGGMGVVYKAEDTRLDRPVALKFLPPHLTCNPEAKQRFIHEAKAASALQHNSICTVHDIDDTPEGELFIVMDYYEGETLQHRIEQGSLKITEAVDLALQVAQGLSEAHKRGIIHRDIKPANILVTRSGVVKILDFGLAKLSGRTMLTRSGSTLGTAAYMSPEQARGDVVDHRTDIWALGVVLYEMIAGQRPFRSDHEQALVYLIMNEEPESLLKICPEATGLAQIVSQALVKNPADRYQSMERFREDLVSVAGGLRPLKAGVRLASVKLAVLPLVNLTGNPEQEYLSDGLTQEMIARLGRIDPQSLSVIARTSVMRYKKTDTPIDQIGRELGVEYVLEGSAQREGARVRVIAELIQVRDQVQLWSDIFEREMSGILTLQNDVAGKVAKALSLKLLPSEQARLAHARPVNPEAHEDYLRGNHYWMQMTPGDLDIAEKYFDLALEKDPAYAPAFVGRANVWLVRNQFGLVPPQEAVPKGRAAALRAIELDGNLASAHEVLAEVRTYIDWDWDGAKDSWRTALELDPNVATAQSLYAHFLAIMGHGEEAVAHSKRSVVLDPFNPLLQAFYAQVLYMQQRYEEAIAVAREAQRLQQDHPVATYALLVITHQMKGMEKQALEAAKAFATVIYNDPRVHAALDEGYGQGGYAEAMRRAADALIARLPEAYSMPTDIAIFYAMAGEKEKAIDWLERGFEVHDPALPYLRFPCYDIVRPDPRFQELLRKLNLSPATGVPPR